MLVSIIPLCKRAKERTKKHGAMMHLIQETPHQCLVESLEATDGKIKWLGWFDTREATITKN